MPDARIVWTSEGGKGSTRGTASFHELTPNLTRIVLVVEYYPAGFFGSFFAIRNPAAHETGEWTEHESLELLATLSVLARLIDSCQVSR